MKKIYHLSTCNTCQKILQEIDLADDILTQDIKQENIDPQTLDWLKDKVGSYEALFSKKARKYRELGLNQTKLTEEDFRKHMLEEYTFLKRPFIIHNEDVFIGNNKIDVAAAIRALKR
jgi:arsenate reductase